MRSSLSFAVRRLSHRRGTLRTRRRRSLRPQIPPRIGADASVERPAQRPRWETAVLHADGFANEEALARAVNTEPWSQCRHGEAPQRG